MENSTLIGNLYDIITTILCFAIPLAFMAGMLWFSMAMLIECATKEPSEGNDKLIWLLVIIFTQLIGALIYYYVRRPQRIENERRISQGLPRK